MSTSGQDDVWTIDRILRWTQTYFSDKGIDTPRLDAEILLAHILKVSRVHLYTHFDQPLRQEERTTMRECVQRRAAREPVAYILGEKEFYGHTLKVNPDVLVPRPETEHLVDAVRAWLLEQPIKEPRILDIGTGSGAIVVALAHDFQTAHFIATDLSADALAVARENIQMHSLSEQVELREGDLFSPVVGEASLFDVVVSNPPYVDEAVREELQKELTHEPALALFAHEAGLSVIRRLIDEAKSYLRPGGLLAFEMGYDQRAGVEKLLRDAGYDEWKFENDLQGNNRLVLAWMDEGSEGLPA
ncbi:peptide chain release factor N(5)-glutamine methyltransferase [Myxococcota bacterium]|nr:peptide chain release factor N(5)-glutamine methyltransferase [Myxococcota bacterium]